MPVVHAQVPGLDGGNTFLPVGVKRVGTLETISVELEGLPVFDIAAPLVANHQMPGQAVPVEIRAKMIERHLDELLHTLLTEDKGAIKTAPTALEEGAVQIEIIPTRGQVALVAKGSVLEQPETLVTLTSLDAEYNQTPREELARRWRDKLNSSLSEAIRGHRADAVHERWDDIKNIAIFLPLAHLCLYGISWFVLLRQKHLRKDIEEHNAATVTTVDDDSLPGTASHGWLVRLLSLENRFRLLAFVRWLLFCIVLAMWIAAATFVLFLFPQTRKIGIYLITTPLLVVIAFFVATIVNRIADLMVDRSLASWQANRLYVGVDIKHATSRLVTLSAAIRAMKAAILYFLAILWVFSRLSITPWSVVTIGALIALTLSFTAQSLVKDVVMGALILIEDQYVIGDYITVQDVTGTVEYMNLRITRIRPSDGRLVTLPNSSITKVENHSKNWSLTTVEFEILPSENVDEVLNLARDIARTMADESDWKDTILNSDEWAGISKLSLAAVTIVIAVRTRPLDHWKVSRELRRRIKIALDNKK